MDVPTSDDVRPTFVRGVCSRLIMERLMPSKPFKRARSCSRSRGPATRLGHCAVRTRLQSGADDGVKNA
jgi:hypothetical protein